MLGLASVLFCTLVAGVRYWDGSYFDASGGGFVMSQDLDILHGFTWV